MEKPPDVAFENFIEPPCVTLRVEKMPILNIEKHPVEIENVRSSQ